jgi:hypothetical protein
MYSRQVALLTTMRNGSLYEGPVSTDHQQRCYRASADSSTSSRPNTVQTTCSNATSDQHKQGNMLWYGNFPTGYYLTNMI